jgi:hypothetical protein
MGAIAPCGVCRPEVVGNARGILCPDSRRPTPEGGGAAQGNALTLEEVFGGGDFAIEVGSYTVTGANGEHVDHGMFMTVHKKVGGDWKIYRDTWNSSMTR